MGRKNKRKNQQFRTLGDGDIILSDEMSIKSFVDSESEMSSMAGDLASPSTDGEVDNLDLDPESEIMDALDLLLESRSSTRVKGLKTLMRQVLRKPTLAYDILSSSSASVTDRLLSIISRDKKPSGTDVVMALKALSMICLSIESGQQSIFYSIKDTLWEIVRRGFKPAVRAASIMTLAISCFVHSTDDVDDRDVLRILYPILSGKTGKIDTAVTNATIRAIALLLSVYSSDYLGYTGCNTLLPLLYPIIINHSNTDVKASAGELIALLLDARRGSGVLGEVMDDDDDGEVESSLDSDFIANNPSNMDEMIAVLPVKLYEMSKENNRYISRKDRVSQRQVYRNIYNTSCLGETQEVIMSVGDNDLTFIGWSETIQLSCFRAVLGEGLLNHLDQSKLMQEIFARVMSTAGDNVMTKLDKKMIYQNYGKQKIKSLQKSRDRDRATRAKNAFMDDP